MAGKARGALAGTPRKTKVRMVPMWCPWDNDGAGGLRLVAADTTHRAAMNDNLGGPAIPYYEWKGFIPLRMFTPEMHKALAVAAQAARDEAAAMGGAVPAWAVAVPDGRVSVDADAA